MNQASAPKPGLLNTLTLWALLVTFDTSVQLLLKTAGNRLSEPEVSLGWISSALASPVVWIAIVCYIATFGLWMLILHRSSLSLAFPATALTYVGVIFGSRWLLSEQIDALQYFGVALIVCGVAMLREEGR
ncbi:EamA family transporter [Pseudomonas sp. NA-150]|uniref:EamA family transporter n=1 Tax=Pseudomonas sp. NA-150 TaxID=3367525 RepID=UPI0037CBE69B